MHITQELFKMSARALIMAAAGTQGPPDAPKIGVAASTGQTTATVTFTAPNNNGSVITSYTATSSPGAKTGTLTQAGSGTITVAGLTAGTAYTFTVKATNARGTSLASAASNSVTTAAPGWSLVLGPVNTGYVMAPVDGSSTGQFLIACTASGGTAGGLYRSADYGGTWTKISLASGTGGVDYGNAYGATISNDGQIIISIGATATGRLMVSTDGGTTFVRASSSIPGNSNYSLATSDDGSAIYTYRSAGYIIYRSTDLGVTAVTVNNGSKPVANALACSSDGSILVGGFTGTTAVTGTYVSSNSGASWTRVSASYSSYSPAVSGNGAVMIMYSVTGTAFAVSRDYGATWADLTGFVSDGQRRMKISYDGSVIVCVTYGATVGNGKVLKSTDYGVTWTDMNAPSAAWFGLAVNSNATQIVVGSYSTYGTYPDTLWIYQ